MLDQNTDRMWYVIGAVIVGAAIIFLANGTLPSLFASVTDSFNDANTDAISVVNETYVNMGPNRLRNGDFSNGLSQWQVNGTARAVSIDGRQAVEVGRIGASLGGIHQSPILQSSGRTLVVFDARAVGTYARPHVGFLNTPSRQYIQLNETWQTYSFRTDVIDITQPGANIFHIYANDGHFYVDNVRVIAQ